MLAIDFDGTIVDHAFPHIGEPMPGAFETLQKLKEQGHKLILYTCRENDGDHVGRQYLTAAVEFCKENGLEFDSINENLEDFRPENSLHRKIYADYYIDDRMVGGFPGWDAIGKVLLEGYHMAWMAREVDRPPVSIMKQGVIMGETSKAHERRVREGWFKYAPEDRSGIDIGCQKDPLNQTFRRYDVIYGDGDATYMEDVADNTYFTVYASHVLEHLPDPVTAIKNWYRILQPGGHLIISIPHRDLYEKKKELPSRWNLEHKWFFLPDKSEPPCTLSFQGVIAEAIPGANLVDFRVVDEGFDYSIPPTIHSCGEFSIEAVIKK
jgi:hypothetical protein